MTSSSESTRPSSRRAFTLIELLVVIGVIAVLMSLLLPALSAARYSSRNTLCMTNLREIGRAVIEYAQENHGYYPNGPQTLNNGWRYLPNDIAVPNSAAGVHDGFDWRPEMKPYFSNTLKKVWVCPLAPDQFANGAAGWTDIDTYTGIVNCSYSFFFGRLPHPGYPDTDFLLVTTPMLKQGDYAQFGLVASCYANQNNLYQYKKFHILAMDTIESNSGQFDMDHIPFVIGQTTTIAGSQGSIIIKPGWKLDFNYVMDDGSVHSVRGAQVPASYSASNNSFVISSTPQGGWVLPVDDP